MCAGNCKTNSKIAEFLRKIAGRGQSDEMDLRVAEYQLESAELEWSINPTDTNNELVDEIRLKIQGIRQKIQSKESTPANQAVNE